MQNAYSVAAHWRGGFDEAGLQAWAEGLRARLAAPKVTIGLVFLSPTWFEHAAAALEVLRVHARIPLLVGCSSPSMVAGAQDFEADAGLVLGLYWLPDAVLTASRFCQEQVEQAAGPEYWRQAMGVAEDPGHGWLVFADPFHLDAERWLSQWNETFAGMPILGGLAGGPDGETRTQVYLNGDVFEEGGVAVSFGGGVRLVGAVSQGCTPIGETWTITRTDKNVIQQIGNRPAYQVLVEAFSKLPAEEQKKARGNLFIGLAMNEYQEDFHRGDFLIRPLLGGDPSTGVLAVGTMPRPGQTIQFHRRDAAAATEDLQAMLARTRQETAGYPIYGGCLCCCNGRGSRLFGLPHHDAGLVQDRLGPLGLAGFFCNGEIGPVAGRNYLHGYTASLALFVKR